MTDRVDFDHFIDNYNQLLRERTSFFSASEEYFARYKVDIVRSRVTGPVRRILEFGCGIGRNIPFLRSAFPGATVVGSDIAAASLEFARAGNPGVEFFVEGASEPQEPFDLVFVAGVFHHVPLAQRLDVARVLRGRLTPGGNLFVFEHNPFNPVTRRIVRDCPYDEDAVLLRPSELVGILENAGLIKARQAYCLFVPPKLSGLVGLEKLLGWLPLGGQYWVQATPPK
jgi:SAM-dependent methyltransferase